MEHKRWRIPPFENAEVFTVLRSDRGFESRVTVAVVGLKPHPQSLTAFVPQHFQPVSHVTAERGAHASAPRGSSQVFVSQQQKIIRAAETEIRNQINN